MKQNYTVRHGALEGVEVFLAVARHRNFRRAAADLDVTPSAVSQAIRALEARLGAALFVRTTRSVGLTAPGRLSRNWSRPGKQPVMSVSGQPACCASRCRAPSYR